MGQSMEACRAGLLGFILLLAAVGCSTAPVQEGPVVEPIFPASKVLDPRTHYASDVYDPWEGFNRTIYRFNYHFDRYVFLPAVNAYQAVTPDVVEKGIHNFFRNIVDVSTLINCILQGRPDTAVVTLTRIIWNTTIGVGGLINVASALDVPRPLEDFGQTLGRWGIGAGPYLVLPFAGPSSVRGAIGLGADFLMVTGIRDWAIDLKTWQSVALTVLQSIDIRAHIPFRYYETGSAFEYDMVRWLYSTKRELDIEK
jgi:phospholipid-binding lipoprotein MlaA